MLFELLVGGVMSRVVAGGELTGSSNYIVHPSNENGLINQNRVGQRAEVSSRTLVGQ